MNGKIKCPYCAEEIQADAKKCRFCGEWLEPTAARMGSAPTERGSADARAVARGLKEKQFHDQVAGCGAFLAALLAMGVGFSTHWVLGLAVFIALVILIGRWYWKE